ncbi:MAG: GNAT family N-acetyltransferase [Parachlamydiales bacterium]|nr:GNAT family N-acetyltransferase [Parachlamydiales bacterium]
MLEGKTIHLRTVKEGDLSKLYSYFDSIRLKGEFLSSELLSEHLFRLEYYESGFWSDEKGTLLIERGDRLIGALWFERQIFFDCLDLHFYIFHPEDRGKGTMQEALPLFCAYLFATKKIERLQISIPDYSKAALKVAQEAGFRFEGIARSALFHRGRYLDLCIYSQIRSECKGIERIYSVST